MINNKLNLFIFDAMGKQIRQMTVPKFFFSFVIALMVITGVGVVAGMYFGISHYQQLKSQNMEMAKSLLVLQQKEALIAQQQEHLADLAQTVDAMKGQLTALYEFETKIRIIANLEPREAESNRLGVGGPDPEDLLPLSTLKQDHPTIIKDMNSQLDNIHHRATVQDKAFADILNKLEGKRERLAATPSIFPTKGWISSGFGYRDAPFSNGKRKIHNGIDIAANRGTPVRATAHGVVTFADRNGLMGNMITIDHGFGMVTLYGHLDKIFKKKGEPVKRGEMIAHVGNTGRSTGPHLHYEVRLHGNSVNPMNYY